METEKRHAKYVEIMDTTLRDGEQTPGVSYTPAEKMEIARFFITHLRMDRLEIGSARVSEGEREAIRAILRWAEDHECAERMELLGFIDGGRSADWIRECGGRVVNLLAKGSENHCRVQLRKTPEQHYSEVRREIEYALKNGLSVNLYLEDWSNGMEKSFDYVYSFLRALKDTPPERIMLPDTLGILTPDKLRRYLRLMYELFPDLRLDFHGHNDYGLVTANSLTAVQEGVSGVHVTVNGLGERTGNQSLEQLVVAIKDHTHRQTRIVEKQLQHASILVQTISGKRIAWNTPVVGSDVYTQTCGIHADGDKKGNLYANNLLPERFGRKRNYALGKLSGKASLEQNLVQMDLSELSEEVRKLVLQEIVRLGDKKKQVSPADLPFIIASVLHAPIKGRVAIKDYEVLSSSKRLPKATVTVVLDGVEYTGKGSGDGGYDAFVKTLRKLLRKQGITFPRLADYEVRIPPGGKTDALVETTITWEQPGGKPLVTTGVDSDQLSAAIVATEKMLDIVIK